MLTLSSLSLLGAKANTATKQKHCLRELIQCFAIVVMSNLQTQLWTPGPKYFVEYIDLLIHADNARMTSTSGWL